MYIYNKIFLLIPIILIFGCSNPLDKSIYEPLPIEDLREAIKKDSSFEFVYQSIEETRKSKSSDIDKAKWSDITYKRVYDIFQLYQNNGVLNQHLDTAQIKTDWELKYGIYIPKFDSIINHWKVYIKENSLSKYVSIEVIGISKSQLNRSVLEFKITPLKGKISELMGEYLVLPNKYKQEFEKKLKCKELSSAALRVFIENDDNEGYQKNRDYFHYSEPIDKTITFIDKYGNPSNDKVYSNKDFKSLSKNYTIYTEVTKFKMNNKKYDNDDLNVPDIIEYYIHSCENSVMSKSYKEDIIQEYFNMDYQGFESYKKTKTMEIAKMLDPNVLEFFEK